MAEYCPCDLIVHTLALVRPDECGHGLKSVVHDYAFPSVVTFSSWSEWV